MEDSVFEENDGVEIRPIAFGEALSGRFSLQRSVSQTPFVIPYEEKVHGGFAKMTEAVKKKNWAFAALIGHNPSIGLEAGNVMDVFLFPLVNVTLFPRTTKPLNIFEPRYLEMVRESSKNGTPIALGFIEDPASVSPAQPGQKPSFVREIAGYGQVQIIEERPNGTLLVFLQGVGKCRLGEVKKSEAPYIVCEAQPLPEDLQVDVGVMPQVHHLNKILARWITQHIPDESQRDVFMRNLTGPEEIVGAFSAYLVRDYDLQQMVLEIDSLNEKIRFLHRLAESSEITA